jgi:hypothetical protein
MKQVHIPRHKRRIDGKWKAVDSYDRHGRPKGKKRIVDKKLVLKSPYRTEERVRDENGNFVGWHLKKK